MQCAFIPSFNIIWEKCPFLAKIASYMPIVQGAAFPSVS
jgi:hypothetical protein